MNEVDMENMEDLKDLEARLYAQIHHEAAGEFSEKDVKDVALNQQQPSEDLRPVHRTVTSTCVINKKSNANKIPTGRYWVRDNNIIEKSQQTTRCDATAIKTNKNPFATPTVKASSNCKTNAPLEQRSTFHSPKPKNIKPKPDNSQYSFKGQPNSFKQTGNLRVNATTTGNGPNKKFNKTQRLQNRKQSLPPNFQINGPFARQVDKLQKAIKYENKKKKAQNSRTKIPTIMQDVIDLDSSSDGDDVILVPLPPTPTVVLDDSDENIDDEPEKQNEEFESIPKIDADRNKSLIEIPSRCNSPSSVMSSDDFIGQSDRSRLVKGSGVADDEDLQLLTADVDSFVIQPIMQKASKVNSETNGTDVYVSGDNSVECLTKEAITFGIGDNYRVEQGTQFKALDVYESESDSVYVKGIKRPTVIRNLDSSGSDELEVIGISSKIKRMRKTRTSGSNKESETNNDESCNSDSNDGVGITAIPFISRGPAVEHCKSKARKDSNTKVRPPSQRGGMSDSDFIATLNNMAQGGSESDDIDEDEDSDVENLPTARDIAEKVLTKKKDQLHAKPQKSLKHISEGGVSEIEDTDNLNVISAEIDEPANLPFTRMTAIPEILPAELDDVFDKIDRMAVRKTEVVPTDPIESSEPNSDAEVEAVEAISSQIATQKSNDKGPVYHVIYSRGNQQMGGIGWNDEMRKFYNNIWDGEHFTVKQVCQNMDNNRHLWKIYTEDHFPKARRFCNLKCHNCCEFGHTRAKCTRPRKPLVCYMCGETGHYEPRCPNTICLRCGNKTRVYTKSCNACTFQNRLICPLCKVRGHTLNVCPDKWRRYHSTTETNTYPNNRIEYKKKKSCCICGARGHWSETCRSAVRFMEYPVIVSEIKSHQKSYNDQTRKVIQSGIALNLMYETWKDYSFELAENTKPQDYYGRFIKSVGMDYLLKRKRNLPVATVDSTYKKAKIHKKYVRNPYLQAEQQAQVERTKIVDVPDQVPEVSESGNLNEDVAMKGATVCDEETEVVNVCDEEAEIGTACDDETEVATICNEETEVAGDCNPPETLDDFIIVDEIDCTDPPHVTVDESNEVNNTFKTPSELSTHIQSPNESTKRNIIVDSDSNYSFSDHFETSAMPGDDLGLPNSAIEYASKSAPIKRSRTMSPLPDYIPLTSTANEAEENLDINLTTGCLSSKQVYTYSDKLDVEDPASDVPCEAKIYLTHFNSKYFLSPEGNKFLTETAKMFDVKARLDWTSVGHVLIIFGTQSKQNCFHRELLLRYRLLLDQINSKRDLNTQKVPKRADALIRLLRNNINKLLSKLGNVNHLLKLVKLQERNISKTAWKIADKSRRTLNMILIGQAGLLDGNMHLDKLLLLLKNLINNYEPDEITSDEFRNDVDTHWKMIFTSYRHDNYTELVRNYNHMLSKNRIPKLNIDPILLGNKVLDTKITNEQKLQTVPITAPTVQKKHAKIVPNPFNPRNAKLLNKKKNALLNSPPPAPSMKIEATVKPNTIAANKDVKPPPPPPFANPEKKPSTVATKIKEVTQNWESTFENLLTEIDGPIQKGPVLNCKAPSMFWSRESIRYLDDCLKMADSNNVLQQKLQRVQTKSKNGSLSYNDYRAVIKLHGAMMGK